MPNASQERDNPRLGMIRTIPVKQAKIILFKRPKKDRTFFVFRALFLMMLLISFLYSFNLKA